MNKYTFIVTLCEKGLRCAWYEKISGKKVTFSSVPKLLDPRLITLYFIGKFAFMASRSFGPSKDI